LAHRGTPDVSYDANPNTGFAVFDSFGSGGWAQFGGTSVGAPQWAALIAIADQGRAATGEASLGSAGTSSAQQALYNVSSSDFTDVTSGTNGDFTAAAGYDLVTGLGSPIANRLVADLVGYAGTVNTPTTPVTFLAGYVPAGATDSAVSAGPANFNVFSIMTSQGFSAGPRSRGTAAPSSFVGATQTGFAGLIGTVLGTSAATSGVNRVSEIAFTPSFSNVANFDGGQRSWATDGTTQTVYVSAGDDTVADRLSATSLRASDVDLLMSDWNGQDEVAPAADSHSRATDHDTWSDASWLDDVDVNDLVAAAAEYSSE
jgi:subtilase family serine protease